MQDDIADSHTFYSYLVASFANILSDNCFVHQLEILQTFIRTVAINNVFLLSVILQGMPWLCYSLTTLYKGT